jgi:hypothetical protein
MTKRVQQSKVDDRIHEIVQGIFEEELKKENISLSRPEKVRLLRQVTKAVLADLLDNIDSTA